jgi:hypothetical protein
MYPGTIGKLDCDASRNRQRNVRSDSKGVADHIRASGNRPDGVTANGVRRAYLWTVGKIGDQDAIGTIGGGVQGHDR